MIQLYGLDHSKLYALTNYKDLKIERTLDGDEVLSFLYPKTDSKYDSIKEEAYIRTKRNEYVVKEVNVDEYWTEFVGKINLEELKGNVINNFETVNQACNDTINLALVGTGWTIGACDVIKKRTVRKANCSSYDILQEIRNIYSCDLRFDSINKKVYVYQSMGNDKGAYFSEQLNLKKLGVQSNSYNFCTRIIPKGKDGLSIRDINGGKEYVENYQYSTKIITMYWEDNRYTDAQSLLEDAKLKLNELSKPIKAYKAEIFDLANNNDKYKNILSYDLGDTITLLSNDKKVKEKQRIIKITEYPDEPEKNSCDIANKTLSFADIQAENQDVLDSASSVLTSNGGIDGSKIDSIDAITQIKNLNTEVARITNLSAINANIDDLYAHKASIDALNATTARVGTLEATTATITQLNAVQANISNLIATKANITDLNASNGRITNLESNTASINTLLAGNLSAANMQAGFITANSGLIANGAIKDAMIDTLSVDKILAGDINTNKFRIISTSGNMLISDNTIQIKDSTRVRVQIGKDASNDYNMYVWDSSGSLMFDATGLKASGIKTKIIRDDMVSDTANINGAKIEKESLVTQINGATTTIKAAKIKLDTENQTLDLAFTSLKSTVTNTTSTVSSQGTSISTIQGQINSKVWSTDITTAVNNITIGGRNLIYNTGWNNDTSYWNLNSAWVLDSTKLNGNKVMKISGATTRKDAIPTTTIAIKPSTTYTISAWFMATDLTNISLYWELPWWSTSGSYGGGLGQYINFAQANTWFKVVKTFTTPSNLDHMDYRLDCMNNGNGTIYFSSMKLEEGNKSTDWTPAPEDIDSQITAINTNYSSLNQTVNSISTSVASLQTTTSDLGTRMISAEGSITALSSSIILKVATTDFNSYKASNDSNISSLQSRVSAAELKITDNSIISTVRSSSAYTSDLSVKANQSDLNTTNTNVSTAQNTANAKRRVFTATPVTPYDVGDLWVTTNGTGDLMTCKTARASGAYTVSDWVKGVKYTDDTTANTVQGNLNTTNSNLGSLTTRVTTAESSITQLNNSISLKVDTSTYTAKMSSLDSSISSLASRLSTAELKITDSSIVSTVRSSTAYTSDISSKANQSDLNTTNTNVYAAQSTANAKRRVFTATPVTPYDVGDLWVTTNGTGDLMTCKTARASGSYTASDWVKGVKYTDDTTANTVQGNLNTTNSNLGSLTTRVTTAESSITQLNNSITLKVNTSDFNTLTNRVNTTESNISIMQGQITSKVNVGDLGTLITQNSTSVKIAVGNIGKKNIAINGSFENNNFYPKGNAWISGTDVDSPYEGRYFCKVSTNGDWQGVYILKNTSVQVNIDYTVVVYVRNFTPVSRGINLFGTNSGDVGFGGYTAPSGSNYTKYVWRVNFGNNPTAELRLENYGTSYNGYICVDAISVYEGWNPNAEYSPNPNELNNVSVVISDAGLNVKNGAISVTNNSGTEVLKGDTNGNLSMVGTVVQRDATTGYLATQLKYNGLGVYDWRTQNDLVGGVVAVKHNASNRGALQLFSDIGNPLFIGWRSAGPSEDYGGSTFSPFMVFDDTSIVNTSTPIGIYQHTGFYDYRGCYYFGNDHSIKTGSVVTGTDNSFWVAAHQNVGSVIIGEEVSNGTLNGIAKYTTSGLYVWGNIACSGSKTRAVDTKKYGITTLNAYETAEPLFGDVGEGIIGEDGLCYIFIDPILIETINTKCNYQVWITDYGEKDDWAKCIRREENYFIVKGTPGLTFGWEIKAKQRDYENSRLEMIENPGENNEYFNGLDAIEEDRLGELGQNYFIDYEKELFNIG